MKSVMQEHPQGINAPCARPTAQSGDKVTVTLSPQGRSYNNRGTYHRASRPVMLIVTVYGSAITTMRP